MSCHKRFDILSKDLIRYANNGWLQELPKPITNVVWDNTVQLSPSTAESLQVVNEDLVEIEYAGRSIKGPVWIMPGQADHVVVIALGFGP